MGHELATQFSVLVTTLRKRSSQDASAVLKKTMQAVVHADVSKADLTIFFSDLYDLFYHDLLDKKMHLEKKVSRLWERLASPYESKSDKERQDIIARIRQL